MVQRELDRFRAMWNEHLIRGDRTVEGHGGGIPSELFRDPIRSRIVLTDDKMYDEQRGQPGFDANGRAAVDETTEYGAEVSPVEPEKEIDVVEYRTSDPIGFDPLLLLVRSRFLEQNPLAVSREGITPRSSTYDKFRPEIAAYIRFKQVCLELAACVVDFMSDDDTYNWAGFGASDSSDEYAPSVGMRAALATIGASAVRERAA